ncbi:MAG TPA: tryptophan--tRNA ligase [Exilispira sp.]|nr:tryptophan--tRNA ligase [Exilispira sp.]
MKRILTGDRPTGPLHIGHYFGSLQNRVLLQNKYETFILIADVQALTDNFNNPEKVRDNVCEVTMDYLASGIDPEKSTIVLQSKIPAIAELTIYFSNLVSLSRLSRNPTVKEEIKQKTHLFNDSVTYGFFGYPVSQAADILSFNADIVPVGEDQAPMIELTREIARRFNSIYGQLFNEPEALIPEKNSRIKGLDGNSKMSKSLNNAIYLKDSEDEIKQKVFSAYTDPLKIRKNDPGHPDGCMVFYYMGIFDFNQIEIVKKECLNGERGCIKCKSELTEIINNYLKPIREKRKILENDLPYVYKILKEGTSKAQLLTDSILMQAKKLMKIDYSFIF